jgi:hypothetical protein
VPSIPNEYKTPLSPTSDIRQLVIEKSSVTLGTIDGGWASCTGQARIVEGDEAADLNRSVRERLFT